MFISANHLTRGKLKKRKGTIWKSETYAEKQRWNDDVCDCHDDEQCGQDRDNHQCQLFDERKAESEGKQPQREAMMMMMRRRRRRRMIAANGKRTNERKEGFYPLNSLPFLPRMLARLCLSMM